jgi:protein-tyrosine phosphatase
LQAFFPCRQTFPRQFSLQLLDAVIFQLLTPLTHTNYPDTICLQALPAAAICADYNRRDRRAARLFSLLIQTTYPLNYLCNLCAVFYQCNKSDTLYGYTEGMKTHILFVCMANIVRSPAAESLCKHALAEQGLEDGYIIDSAGSTPGFAGQLPHPIMTRLAASIGVVNEGISRTLTRQDLEDFDLILVMDKNNFEDTIALARGKDLRDKIHYLREFDPDNPDNLDISDPIMGTAADFAETFQIIHASVNGLVDYLKKSTSKRV